MNEKHAKSNGENKLRPELALDKVPPGFQRTHSESRPLDLLSFYSEGVEFIGWVCEVLEGPKAKAFHADIYQLPGPGQKLAVHDFLRLLIINKTGQYVPRQTAAGTVLVAESTVREGGRKHGARTAAWTSKDNLALIITSVDVDLNEIIKLYGGKFPSSLPADVKFDKTSWARQEIDTTLKRLRRILAGEKPNPFRHDMFDFHLHFLWDCVYVPSVEPIHNTDQEKRRDLLDLVKRWWKENKDQTYWDEELGWLIARGQSPKEVQEKKEREEREKIEALLRSPITEAELAAARKKLIDRFEKGMEEDAAREARERGKELGGDRVSWKKIKDGEWVHQYPSSNNGPLITRNYTGPQTLNIGYREPELWGTFEVHQVDPYQGPSDWKECYVYDRLEGTWYFKHNTLPSTPPEKPKEPEKGAAELPLISFMDQKGEDVQGGSSTSSPEPRIKLGIGRELRAITADDVKIDRKKAMATIHFQGRVLCDFADVVADRSADIKKVTIKYGHETGESKSLSVPVVNASANPVSSYGSIPATAWSVGVAYWLAEQMGAQATVPGGVPKAAWTRSIIACSLVENSDALEDLSDRLPRPFIGRFEVKVVFPLRPGNHFRNNDPLIMVNVEAGNVLGRTSYAGFDIILRKEAYAADDEGKIFIRRNAQPIKEISTCNVTNRSGYYPVWVYINDPAINAANVHKAQVRANGHDFPLVLDHGRARINRPFIAVDEPLPRHVNAPNVTLIPEPAITTFNYKSVSEKFYWSWSP